MGRMGHGYGSEWHSLRWLGYHRVRFNELVAAAIGGIDASAIRWLDSPFNKRRPLLDEEWKGLEFLAERSAARREWAAYWPTTGNPPNWDAIGVVGAQDVDEWILVEAKAHTGELASTCGAKPRGGRSLIERRLAETKRTAGVAADRDWLCGYYQYANRLAILKLLAEQGVSARLVFVYFVGDKHATKLCPADAAEWTPALSAMYSHLGLSGTSDLERRTHALFLPVCEET